MAEEQQIAISNYRSVKTSTQLKCVYISKSIRK